MKFCIRLQLALCALSLASFSAMAQTTITDTVYLRPGTPWTGVLTITWPAFTTASGQVVGAGGTTISVRNGALTVNLYPNVSGTPPVVYAAHYLTTVGADRDTAWDETWNVYASASPLILDQVRATSSLSGKSVLNGTGAPGNTLGQNGDYYIRNETSCLYGPKVSNAWPGSCVSLIGPVGPTGVQGPTGATGPVAIGATHSLGTISGGVTLTATSTVRDRWTATLSGDVTFTLTGATAGETLQLDLTQDGTGNHNVTLPLSFTGAGCFDLTAGAETIQQFFWDGTNAKASGEAVVIGGSAALITTGCQALTLPTAPDTLLGQNSLGINNPSDNSFDQYIDKSGVQHRGPVSSTILSDSSNIKRVTDITSVLTATVGVGGVTVNTPVKYLSGTVVAVTGTEGTLGIAEATVAQGGTVVVDLIGASHCIASGSITATNYVGPTTGGKCIDLGQSARSSIPTSTNLLGKAGANYTDGQLVSVDLVHPYATGASGVSAGCGVTMTGSVLSWNPADMKNCQGLWEPFWGWPGTNTTHGSIWPQINQNNTGTWVVTTGCCADPTTYTNSQSSHMGVVKFSAPASLNPQTSVVPNYFSGLFSVFATATEWTYADLFLASDVTNGRTWTGWSNNNLGTHPTGNSGIYWRFDPTVDTHAMGVICNLGTCSTVDFGAAPSAGGWNAVIIQRQSTGLSSPKITMTWNGTVKTFCASGCDQVDTNAPPNTQKEYIGSTFAYNGTPGTVYWEMDARGLFFSTLGIQ